VRIPDVLQDVFLIEKDSKNIPNTKGWPMRVRLRRVTDSFVSRQDGYDRLRVRRATREWRTRITSSRRTGRGESLDGYAELGPPRGRKVVLHHGWRPILYQHDAALTSILEKTVSESPNIKELITIGDFRDRRQS